MIPLFANLTESEVELMKDAIPMITILIAGADDNIEAKERAWAEKVTNIRTYSVEEAYQAYYTEVGQDFQVKLDKLIEQLPEDATQRNEILSAKLAQLNPILAKLDPKYGAQFYKEFKRFADHVAKASGGFLGFFSVSKEEARWTQLSMLDEIVYVEEEEE